MVRVFVVIVATVALGGGLRAQALDTDRNLVLATRGDATVRMVDVDTMLLGAKPEQRPEIVSTAARVEQLLDSRLLAVQLVNRGRAQKLDHDPEVQRRLAIATEKALGEIILDVLVDKADAGDLEALAKESYAAKKSSFVQPESWTVRHLLVKPVEGEDEPTFKARATVIYDQALAKPADFEALVKVKSEDPSVGQNEGAFTLGRDSEFVPEFLEASFKLTTSLQFAPLTKTQFGYHVIQLLEKSEQQQLSYERVRSQLISSLNESFRDRVKSEMLSDLRSADPKYIEENIRKLVVRYDPPPQSSALNVDTAVPSSVPASGAPK